MDNQGWLHKYAIFMAIIIKYFDCDLAVPKHHRTMYTWNTTRTYSNKASIGSRLWSMPLVTMFLLYLLVRVLLAFKHLIVLESNDCGN